MRAGPGDTRGIFCVWLQKICNLKNNSKFLIPGFKAREVYELKYALKCLSRMFPNQSLK